MEVNGKEYIAKEDVERDYILKSQAEKAHFKISGKSFTDEVSVMALGSFELSNYIATRVSLDFLEKAIAILKIMNDDEITFAWAKDMPLVMGSHQDAAGKTIMGGIAIGPRVKHD